MHIVSFLPSKQVESTDKVLFSLTLPSVNSNKGCAKDSLPRARATNQRTAADMPKGRTPFNTVLLFIQEEGKGVKENPLSPT